MNDYNVDTLVFKVEYLLSQMSKSEEKLLNYYSIIKNALFQILTFYVLITFPIQTSHETFCKLNKMFLNFKLDQSNIVFMLLVINSQIVT